jgi:DNA-directed RNA polymerase sigma subunit (sigma70/sigma32)
MTREFAHFLADPAAGDPVEEAERSLLRQPVQRRLEGLPELERLIVERRFGLQGEPKLLETVGYKVHSHAVSTLKKSQARGVRNSVMGFVVSCS